jgi:hypothetical protein
MQTIGGGCWSGVGGHLVGRGRRGGRGLTQGKQWPVRDDGVANDALEGRRVALCTSDPGGGCPRRRWRSFPPLWCSLVAVGLWLGVCACEPRTTSRDLHHLFIALCDAGLPTMDWLGAPDQGARPSPLRMRDRSNV